MITIFINSLGGGGEIPDDEGRAVGSRVALCGLRKGNLGMYSVRGYVWTGTAAAKNELFTSRIEDVTRRRGGDNYMHRAMNGKGRERRSVMTDVTVALWRGAGSGV